MSRKPPAATLLRKLGTLIEASPAKISAANEWGSRVCQAIDEFKDAVEMDAQRLQDMNRLAAGVDRAAKRLIQSAHNLKKDKRLRADWARLAELDLQRLKDEALALHEFLLANANSFKLKPQARVVPFMDLQKLLEELRENDAIGERAFFLLTTYLAKNKHPKLKDQAVIDQLSQISIYLSELREVRQVSGDAR
jgi:hypothetical protein